MDKKTLGFIIQTAQDYDLPVNTVQDIYEQWNKEKKFYQKLEEHLEELRNFS